MGPACEPAPVADTGVSTASHQGWIKDRTRAYSGDPRSPRVLMRYRPSSLLGELQAW